MSRSRPPLHRQDVEVALVWVDVCCPVCAGSDADPAPVGTLIRHTGLTSERDRGGNGFSAVRGPRGMLYRGFCRTCQRRGRRTPEVRVGEARAAAVLDAHERKGPGRYRVTLA
jgi:hypothetical protein